LSKSIYNEEYRKLIDALKSARITAGMTQQQVADALGKPQSFVAKVEGYERRLDVIEFWRISALLGIDQIGLLKTNLEHVEL